MREHSRVMLFIDSLYVDDVHELCGTCGVPAVISGRKG